MDFFKESEYWQMVARKERELDLCLAETSVEETEEEFNARIASGEYKRFKVHEEKRDDNGN